MCQWLCYFLEGHVKLRFKTSEFQVNSFVVIPAIHIYPTPSIVASALCPGSELDRYETNLNKQEWCWATLVEPLPSNWLDPELEMVHQNQQGSILIPSYFFHVRIYHLNDGGSPKFADGYPGHPRKNHHSTGW